MFNILFIITGVFSHTLSAADKYENTVSRSSQTLALESGQTAPPTISLQEAVSKSLNNHRDTQIAENRLKQTKTKKFLALTKLLPRLYAKVQYTRNHPEIKTKISGQDPSQVELYRRVAQLLKTHDDDAGAEQMNKIADRMMRRSPSNEIITRPKNSVDSTLGVTIPIFNGPNYANFLTMKKRVSLSRAQLTKKQADTILETTKSYMQVRHAQSLVNLKKAQALTGKENHEKVQNLYNKGLSSYNDLLRSQQNLALLRTTQEEAILNFKNEMAKLGLMIDQHNEFNTENVEEPDFRVLKRDINSLIEIALKNRPDLKAQRKSLEVSKKQGLTNALRFLPTISFDANATYTTNVEGFKKDPFSFAFMLNAEFSFFDGGSRFALLKEGRLKQEEENIKLSHLNNMVKAQIRGHKLKINKLLKKRRSKNLYFEFSKENMAVVKDKYDQGLSSLKDFLEAQQQLFDSQIEYKKVNADLLQEKLLFLSDLGLLTNTVFSE